MAETLTHLCSHRFEIRQIESLRFACKLSFHCTIDDQRGPTRNSWREARFAGQYVDSDV